MVKTIENTDLKWLKDPNYLASRYLDPVVAYPLKGHNNFKGFYEQILIETDSVDFEHLYRGEKDRTSPFLFSKPYLKKMLNPTDWGLDPNRTIRMPGIIVSTMKILKRNILGSSVFPLNLLKLKFQIGVFIGG